eukprot:6466657-Amphidinium_carterae.2
MSRLDSMRVQSDGGAARGAANATTSSRHWAAVAWAAHGITTGSSKSALGAGLARAVLTHDNALVVAEVPAEQDGVEHVSTSLYQITP